MPFLVPDDVDLLQYFGVPPVEQGTSDGYSCYAVNDTRGVELRFSFDTLERSVQTVLSSQRTRIALISREGADRMYLRAGTLCCEFSTLAEKTMLTLQVHPVISVVWAGLCAE